MIIRYLSYHKRLVFLITFGISLAILGGMASKPAAALGSCRREGAVIHEYNEGGYRYRLVELSIFGNDPDVVHDKDPSGAYIRSENCDQGNYGGSMVAGPPNDLVYFDRGVLGWQETSGSRRVRPTQILLGVRRATPISTPACVPIVPTFFIGISPPLYFCVSNNFAELDPDNTISRHAAAVDDAGRLVIGGGTGDRTIWCNALITNTPDRTDCSPDIGQHRVNDNPAAGAGFLFQANQTCAASLPNCTEPYWTRWYIGAGLYSSTDLTAHIEREPVTNYLVGMFNHLEARNTYPGGFGATVRYTLRYPLNAGNCSVQIIPSNPVPNQPITIRVTATNTGTRPWRQSDGHRIAHRSGVGSGSRSVPSGIWGSGLPDGPTFSLDFSAVAPSTSRTTQWEIQQEMGGYTSVINQCTANIAVGPPPGFTVTPGASAGPLLPDAESPQTVELNGSATVTIGGPAPTVVNNIRVTRRYYIDRLTGSDRDLLNQPATSFNLPGSQTGVVTNWPQTFNIAGEGLVVGDQLCVEVTVSPTTGTVDFNGNQAPSPGTGTQTARNCVRVVNRPYVRIYGNDVATGGTFGTGTCTGGRGIHMWARDTNVGSGGQLSVLSLGPITQFSSAMLRSSPPIPPNGLTFANTVNPPGQFGGSHCITDFFAASTGASFDNSNATIDLNAVPDGTVMYRQPAGGIVRINGSVDRGKQVRIYVLGNVHINGNITYVNPNTWNSTADIASLQLIVQGNIYIGSNVTQINGLFVAQPTNIFTGIIYTCAHPFTAAPFAGDQLFANCGNQLTINGSLVAQHIKWLRTYSSLRHSVAGEHPQGANHPCGGGSPPNRPVCAAEIVNSMPEIYLAIPASPNNAPASLGNYDYITSLSPTL